jgi:hypothetical protein
MRELMSGKLISAIKVKAVSDGEGYDPGVFYLSRAQYHPILIARR